MSRKCACADDRLNWSRPQLACVPGNLSSVPYLQASYFGLCIVCKNDGKRLHNNIDGLFLFVLSYVNIRIQIYIFDHVTDRVSRAYISPALWLSLMRPQEVLKITTTKAMRLNTSDARDLLK